jgi:hypothetical protein
MGELREIECHAIEKRHSNADRRKIIYGSLKSPLLLVGLDDVAGVIVNANHSIAWDWGRWLHRLVGQFSSRHEHAPVGFQLSVGIVHG